MSTLVGIGQLFTSFLPVDMLASVAALQSLKSANYVVCLFFLHEGCWSANLDQVTFKVEACYNKVPKIAEEKR